MNQTLYSSASSSKCEAANNECLYPWMCFSAFIPIVAHRLNGHVLSQRISFKLLQISSNFGHHFPTDVTMSEKISFWVLYSSEEKKAYEVGRRAAFTKASSLTYGKGYRHELIERAFKRIRPVKAAV